MGQVLCGYNDNEGHNNDHQSFGDEGLSKLSSTSPNYKATNSSSRKSRFSRPRKAKKLSELNPRERARAAIIGGFVADAATMPLHLIYDQMGLDMLLDGNNHITATGGIDCTASVAGSLSTNSTTRSKASSRVSRSPSQQSSSSATTTATDNDLMVVNHPTTTANSDTNIGSGVVPLVVKNNRYSSPTSSTVSQTTSKKLRAEPEFFPQPSSPFYSYAVGRQSPYGDEAHTFLRMISTRGFFEPDECCEEAFRFLRAYMERGGGRTNAVLRTFVERRESGLEWNQCSHASDAQFFCITKVPILVARYAGSPHMLAKVEEGVRMFQTSDTVLSACRLSARLLERVIMGHSVLDTLRWATNSSSISNSNGSSSKSDSSSNNNNNQVTGTASSDPASAAAPGPPAGPDLSDGERAFLRVLEGMDGFMGCLTVGTRARATASGSAAAPSSSTHCNDIENDACSGSGGEEDEEDEEETEAVHAIITNGDSSLIFASAVFHPGIPTLTTENPNTLTPAINKSVATTEPIAASVEADDDSDDQSATIAAVCSQHQQSQTAPSSSSPSKLSRLRMVAARAAAGTSCGDDNDIDNDNDDNDKDLDNNDGGNDDMDEDLGEDSTRKQRTVPSIIDTTPLLLPDPPPVVTATATANDSNSNSNISSNNKKSSKGNSNSSSNSSSVPFSVAAEALGLGPQLPGSLEASLVALACFPSYKAAVRANIVAGGDNALRAWLIGSLLAAEQGVESIPSEWIERTLLYPQIEIMATRLAGSNPYFETMLDEKKGCRIGVLLA